MAATVADLPLPTSAPEGVRRNRLQSIDVLRGLVMVIMALDHCRDFIDSVDGDPTKLATTNWWLFLTRLVTHFCAPTFVLLCGLSVGLALRRSQNTAAEARRLVGRGIWLIVLEFSIISMLWTVQVDHQFTIAQVIWAIGAAMIMLAPVVRWGGQRAALFLGIVIVVGHNLVSQAPASGLGPWATIYQFLLGGGMVQWPGGRATLVLYPAIPWFGVMCLGYGLTPLFSMAETDRRRSLLRLGIGMLAAFLVLRVVNHYGDPSSWSNQASFDFTVISFLNVTKYPPALMYLLLTLGVALVGLSRLPDEFGASRSLQVLSTFGSVPMFYYLAHLFVLHLAAIAVIAIVSAQHAIPFPPRDGRLDPGLGLGLSATYALWAVGVFVLYFPCRRYAKYKASHRKWWLAYL